jgi:hypothetical protein
VVFIDFKQAFDKIWRVGLWRKLIGNGINGKILNVMVNMYHKAKSCVQINTNRSDYFPCSIGVRQGENLSPLLFALYLNDLEKFLNDHGFNGPSDLHINSRCEFLDNLEIYLKLAMLLYADDMILMADNPNELQNALNLLQDYCEEWHLMVNINKSKAMIFSRGKPRVNIPEFIYAGNRLELVDHFTYLGVTFSHNGNFAKAIKERYNKGMKAMFGLLRVCRKFSLTIELSLEIFDKVVTPVLLYGSEVWGNQNTELLDRVQVKFYKYLLRLPLRTPTVMVMGELGRYSLKIPIALRMLSFWNRLRNGKIDKWAYIFYSITREHLDKGYLNQGWCKSVKSLLDSCGLTQIWNAPEILSNSQLKIVVEQIMRDQCEQLWRSEVNNDTRCHIYKMFKQSLSMESYVKKLPIYQAIIICKFRCGSIKFPETVTRMYKNETTVHVCGLCDQVCVRDELHYFITCSHFRPMRIRLFPNIQELPQVFYHELFYRIMSNSSRVNLSKVYNLCKEFLSTVHHM